MAQQWKYNGVELNEDMGINLYEMDFRMYDPAIGRFYGIDPVTHFSQGTSVAFDNNPVFWADPSGADATGMVPLSYQNFMETGNSSGVGFGGYNTSGAPLGGGSNPDTEKQRPQVVAKYALLDDKENIHEASVIRTTIETEETKKTLTTATRKDKIKKITTTTLLQSKDGEVEIIGTGRVYEEYTKTVTITIGGDIIEKISDYTKTVIDGYNISFDPQAEAFAGNIYRELKNNSNFNPWNGNVSIPFLEEAGIISGAASLFVNNNFTTLSAKYLLPAAAGNYIGNKHRNSADFSGKQIFYNVDDDGKLKKI